MVRQGFVHGVRFFDGFSTGSVLHGVQTRVRFPTRFPVFAAGGDVNVGTNRTG
jgi:hypothetical protein